MGLKELRIQAGLTQSQLATYSGVNLRSLQDYEQGHKTLASAKGETLYRLSQVLGYNMNALLEMEGLQLDCFVRSDDAAARMNRILVYEKSLQKKNNSNIHFPIVVEDEYVDMSRIYPTKQREVKDVLEALRDEETVNDLHLFGSSITIRCHKDSDVDFAVGLTDFSRTVKNHISERIQECCNWKADILWMDRLTEQDRVFADIQKGLKLI